MGPPGMAKCGQSEVKSNVFIIITQQGQCYFPQEHWAPAWPWLIMLHYDCPVTVLNVHTRDYK